MSRKLKLIKDPEGVEKKLVEIPTKLNLRNIEVQEKTTTKDGKSEVKKVKISEEAMNLAKNVKIGSFPKQVDCQDIMNRVAEGIEQRVTRKAYYVGKDKNQLFCGPVLQVIPIGTYTQITSGQSTYSPKVPFENKKFKFVKTRQLMFRVGKRISNDYVVVVGRNGCVVIESGAYCVLNMPLYIVEPTGDYYYLNDGNRKLELGPGSHLALYTEKGPILFATVQKSEKVKRQMTDVKSTTESVKSIVGSEKLMTDTPPKLKQPKEEKTSSDGNKNKGSKSEEKKKTKVKTDDKEKKEIKAIQTELIDKKNGRIKAQKGEFDHKFVSSPVKQEIQLKTEKSQIKPEFEVKPEPEKREIEQQSEVKPFSEFKLETEVESEQGKPGEKQEGEVKSESEIKQKPENPEVKQVPEAKLEQEEPKAKYAQTQIMQLPSTQPNVIHTVLPEVRNGHQNANLGGGILLALAIIAALVSSVIILYYIRQ